MGTRSLQRHMGRVTSGPMASQGRAEGIACSVVPGVTAAFAAGNRALLKMSEFTPSTASVFAELAARYFSSDELAVVGGDQPLAAAFAALPFDHLLFTGSTAVGRHVMLAAAANLLVCLWLPPAVPWSVLPLGLYTTGMSLAAPSITLFILDLFPELRGTVSSLQGFVQTLFASVVAGVIAPLDADPDEVIEARRGRLQQRRRVIQQGLEQPVVEHHPARVVVY